MMGTQEDATLPPGWANVTIGEVVSPTGVFVDGDWVESTDQDPDGDVRLIQLADIGDGWEGFSALYDKENQILLSLSQMMLAIYRIGTCA